MKKRILLYVLYAGLALAVVGAFGIFLLVKDLPSPELLTERRVAESTKIFDREGKTLLYEIFEEERRTIVPFEKIPAYVKQATVAIEDKDFYKHPAFALKAFIRAVFANLTQGWGSQGGSTITQQLAKNAFLSNEKTITRKIKELVIAFRLEKKFTKDEILYLYLNQIPYGSNAYGIESAAQTFFQKTAQDLTLPEAALLAALPQAPSYLSPWGSHLTDLLQRKNRVLDEMFSAGYINAEQRDSAKSAALQFVKADNSLRAPHFSIAIQEYLIEKYGEEAVRRGGLKITTTLDWELQQIAEKVIAEGVERNDRLYKGTNAALVAQDSNTGHILALVGSRNYFDEVIDGNFNVATQGLRQPGSAMKPFVYLTAFKKGYPPETVLFDLKTEFDTTKDPEKSYQPENFDHIFRGPISLRNALAQSINVPAVKTLYLAGINNVLKTMRLFGVTTLTDPSRYGLSLTLGGGEVRLVEMVSAYATLAEEGTYHPQSMILKIEDKNGNILEEYKDNPTPVFEPEYVRQINDILSDPEARSSLFSGSLGLTVFPGFDVALKTGTTNDYRDAWAFGYTPNLAVGVWAGNNDNTPMQRSGGSILAAVPIWNAFLVEALKKQTPDSFVGAEPVLVDKPMLNGQYVTFNSSTMTAPEVHTILYYVNKNNPLGPSPIRPQADSQFENWEVAVQTWVSTQGASTSLIQIISGSQPGQDQITFITPTTGAQVTSPLLVRAAIVLPSKIKRVETFFNNVLVHGRDAISASAINYESLFVPPVVSAQNILRIVATDEFGTQFFKEVILIQ